MAALAKKKSVAEPAAAWRGAGAVRVAQAGDQAQTSAVHQQHALLEAAFGEPEIKPYPGVVKAAILIGAPALMWAALVMVAASLSHG